LTPRIHRTAAIGGNVGDALRIALSMMVLAGAGLSAAGQAPAAPPQRRHHSRLEGRVIDHLVSGRSFSAW
jgi:hypothetical protein